MGNLAMVSFNAGSSKHGGQVTSPTEDSAASVRQLRRTAQRQLLKIFFLNPQMGSSVMGPSRHTRWDTDGGPGLIPSITSSQILPCFCCIPIESAVWYQKKLNPYPKSHFIYFQYCENKHVARWQCLHLLFSRCSSNPPANSCQGRSNFINFVLVKNIETDNCAWLK